MERRITSIYERALTTTVGNVDHIESQSLNGVAVVKVFLQPHANVDGAIAEVDAEAQATYEATSPGITPPLVIRYSASTVPILQLGLSGKGLSEQQLNDLGTNFIRPQLATIPGAAVPLALWRKGAADHGGHRFLAAEVRRPFSAGRRECGQCPERYSALRHGQDR